MVEERSSSIRSLRAEPGRAGIFLDFDGTLSEIVARPDLATPFPGSRGVLESLTQKYGLVAIVSGRTGDQIRRLLRVPGLTVFGLYGLTGPEETHPIALPRVDLLRLAHEVDGAWVEDKAASLALHFRATRDPSWAEERLRLPVLDLARRHGLRVVPGKMVLELVPPSTPGKGQVILREVRARGLDRCLYAGDDAPDLDAFVALDLLEGEGVMTMKVAVRGPETPEELTSAADLVVEGPLGLIRVLAQL